MTKDKKLRLHSILLVIVLILWVVFVSYGVGIWIHWIAGVIVGLANCLYVLAKVGKHIK